MNVKVEADVIDSSYSLSGSILTPNTSVEIHVVVVSSSVMLNDICLAFTPITINGNSVSAVQPGLVEGRMAALI